MCTGCALLSRLSGVADVFQGWTVGFGGGSVTRHTLLTSLMRRGGLCKMRVLQGGGGTGLLCLLPPTETLINVQR